MRISSLADPEAFLISDCFKGNNLGPKEVIKKNRLKSTATQTRWDPKKKVILNIKKRNKKNRPVSKFLLVREKKLYYFTGLSKKRLRVFWEFLSDCKEKLEIIGHPEKKKTGEIKLAVFDQYLMTLMILRKNYSYAEISHQFGIKVHLVAQLFNTWLQFMYFELKDFEEEWFTTYENLPKPLPRHFRNPILKKVRCVIGKHHFFQTLILYLEKYLVLIITIQFFFLI